MRFHDLTVFLEGERPSMKTAHQATCAVMKLQFGNAEGSEITVFGSLDDKERFSRAVEAFNAAMAGRSLPVGQEASRVIVRGVGDPGHVHGVIGPAEQIGSAIGLTISGELRQ